MSFVLATEIVSPLLAKLPADTHQKEPSSDVVLNICGALNNLVTSSKEAAQEITKCGGLPKLMDIKMNHDSR